jgi:hypothetical protein
MGFSRERRQLSLFLPTHTYLISPIGIDIKMVARSWIGDRKADGSKSSGLGGQGSK